MSPGRTHTWLLFAAFLFACQAQPDGLPPQPDSGPPKAVLDDCPEDHVPKPGGGCMRVGVALCADGKGIEGPPDWSCKRVGVDECTIDGGPGLAGPPDWKCKAIGPPRRCKPGWAKQNGNWWCEPILPRDKCPAGTMEVIGKTTCQPAGHCDTPSTTNPSLFVDQTYTGTDADGSKAKPYPTIGQALAAAKAGAVIEVAQGTYKENLTIDKQITLRAGCDEQVTIEGQSKDKATIYVGEGGDSSFSRIEITGPRAGIEAYRAKIALKHVLVRETVGDGVVVASSEATFHGCTIRDTQKTPYDGAAIRAIDLNWKRSKVEVTDSVLLRNWDTGILAIRSDLTVNGSVVADTRAEPLKMGQEYRPEWYRGGIYGRGPGSLKVTDCLIAKNPMGGIFAQGTHAVVQRSVVRDTWPIRHLFWGGGVLGGPGGSLILKDCLVRANHQYNVVLGDQSLGTVERTVVGPGLANPENGAGIGVFVPNALAVSIRDSLLADHFSAGVDIWRTNVTIQGTVIRDTAPKPLEPKIQWSRGEIGLYGWGINAFADPGQPKTLVVTDSAISDNTFAGISASQLTLAVTGSRIEGTRLGIDWDGKGPRKSPFAYGIRITAQGTTKARLDARDTIISGVPGEGIYANNAPTSITRVAIVNSRPSTPDGAYLPAIGIHAEPRSWDPMATELTIRDTLVDHARYLGVAALGVEADIERTIVRDTQPERLLGLDVPWDDRLGAGVFSGSLAVRGWPQWRMPASLVLKDSLLERNHAVGLHLWSTKADVSGCSIKDTQSISGKWGDGIAATQADKSPMAVNIEDTLVLGSGRAGLFLSGGGASVRRSTFAEGGLAIAPLDGADLERPSPDDNRYVDNLDPHDLSFDNNLEPPPMPTLPSPAGAK